MLSLPTRVLIGWRTKEKSITFRNKICHWWWGGHFPGGPVAEGLCSQCSGPRFDPWSGNQVPHATTKSLHAVTERSHMPQQRSYVLQLNPVQFSCSVVSDFLWPHGLQHARPPCPSPTPRVYSNSRPLSWWCHPTISSSVVRFSSFCLSQHQGFFKWVSSLHQVAKVLEFQLQHQSFQWIFRTDFL